MGITSVVKRPGQGASVVATEWKVSTAQ